MKKLLFFCIASAILLFSIIVTNIAPFIGRYYSGDMSSSCKYLSDLYDYNKDELKYTDEQLKPTKKSLDRCNNNHAMEGLEFTSLIVNLVIGFICALLGLFNYLNLGNIGKIAGLIGLGGGAIGFVLTFVYVIESGLIFDDKADFSSINVNTNNFVNLKIDSDGAFLEWDSSRSSYKCIFYEKENEDSIYLKYSDFGNKYLSYNKDAFLGDEDKYNACNFISSSSLISGLSNWAQRCKNIDEKTGTYQIGQTSNCNKIYNIPQLTTNTLKIMFDKWLTSIIFSCFIFLFDIGLALFGFLLFRESSGSSGPVSIK